MTNREPRSSTAPTEACPSCGKGMRRIVGTLRLPVNGESVAVTGILHLNCAACGEKVLDGDAVRKLERGAFAAYRRRHRLLSGAEIRRLREDLGVTQRQLATMLRLGPNTLSRWEIGRNVQSAAMDLLLRVLRDVPSARAYLLEKAA